MRACACGNGPTTYVHGDVGSALLGFLAGAFGLWPDAVGIAPLWISVLIFSPSFLDATVTASLRMLRRERFWEVIVARGQAKKKSTAGRLLVYW